MKTLHPVDEETADKLGRAYVICSYFPDVFGDVTMERFCGMFVDIIPEGEDEQTARMKEYAPEMYAILKALLPILEKHNEDMSVFCIKDLIARVKGEEVEA